MGFCQTESYSMQRQQEVHTITPVSSLTRQVRWDFHANLQPRMRGCAQRKNSQHDLVWASPIDCSMRFGNQSGGVNCGCGLCASSLDVCKMC
eukprot:1397431-Amphidinium_carterae.1